MRKGFAFFLMVGCGSGSDGRPEDSGADGGGPTGGPTTDTATVGSGDLRGGLAIAFAPVVLPANPETVYDVHLPLMGDGVDLPATTEELELAPGLFVTVGQGDLEAPAFQPDATWMGAVVPSQALPIELDGEVLAVWYLMPFDYEASGLPIRITNSYGAVEGDDLTLWVGRYVTYAWERAAGVTVSGDDLVADAGLTHVSTLALVRNGSNNPPPNNGVQPGDAKLSGTVYDPDGQPVEGARVQFCRDVCKTTHTDAQGVYSYDDLDVGPASFEIIPPAPE